MDQCGVAALRHTPASKHQLPFLPHTSAPLSLPTSPSQVVRIGDLTSAVLSAPAILALLAPEDVMLIKTFDSSGLAAHSLPTSLEQAVLPTTDVTQLLLLLQSYYGASSVGRGHARSLATLHGF